MEADNTHSTSPSETTENGLGSLTEVDKSKGELVTGRLRKLKPDGVIPKDTNPRVASVDRLMLSCAVIFNDLKGLTYFDNWLNKYRKPAANEVSAHSGEWTGIKMQIMKYYTGTVHEALRLLEEHKELIQSGALHNYEVALSRDDRRIWQLLLEVTGIKDASEDDEDSIASFRKLLSSIRSNVAFHYNQSGIPLIQGFKTHFFDSNYGDASKFAYYSSSGSEFYEVRYFYADAALSGFLKKEMGHIGDPDHIVGVIFRMGAELGKVLAGLLAGYVKLKPRA